MGDPQNGWFVLVYFMENPTKMDDDWGYPYDSGNPHISEGPTRPLPISPPAQLHGWQLPARHHPQRSGTSAGAAEANGAPNAWGSFTSG